MAVAKKKNIGIVDWIVEINKRMFKRQKGRILSPQWVFAGRGGGGEAFVISIAFLLIISDFSTVTLTNKKHIKGLTIHSNYQK